MKKLLFIFVQVNLIKEYGSKIVTVFKKKNKKQNLSMLAKENIMTVLCALETAKTKHQVIIFEVYLIDIQHET